MKLTLQEKLIALRRRKGLSQKQVGKASGIGRNTIGRIESGQLSPRVEQLEAIADAMGFGVIIEIA